MTVPFYDLTLQHPLSLVQDVQRDLERVAADSSFTNGEPVAEFEAAWAEACGRSYAVGTASGLDALKLSLLALGIGPGDEVLVPAMTFQATWEAVAQCGATPVGVDVDPVTLTMDPEQAREAIDLHTEAIVPVHLYGMPADLASLRAITTASIVADACQAHGTRLRDAFADAYSFYPSKNLGAWGDAGAVVTDNEELADTVRWLRDHGQSSPHVHEEVGYTSRLDTLQAAVLLRKLPHLNHWNRERWTAAAFYNELLDGVGDLSLPILNGNVFHLYVVRTARRDELKAHLEAAGIGCRVHYPTPPHLTPAFAHLGYGIGSFPVAERAANEVLSLPLFPGITTEQKLRVCAAVKAFYEDIRFNL